MTWRGTAQLLTHATDDVSMNITEIPAAQNGSIRVGKGETIHFGSKFGSECGAGFNRRGQNSPVARTAEPITCAKCLKIKAARGE